MSKCKKTIITDNKNIETTKQLNKSNNYIAKRVQKNIENIVNVCLEGFAEITGIRISSSLNFIGEMLLIIKKRIGIESNEKFNSAMSFVARKKIQIDSRLAINAVLNVNKETSIDIDSDLEFTIGQSAVLGDLDNFTLSEMDVRTLGNLGFGEGVNFILEKRLGIESSLEYNTTVDLLLYSYNNLSILDPQTIGTLDTETLEDLDRSVVV